MYFEAALPVLTISSKCVEARRTAAECFFSLTCSVGAGFRQWTTLVLEISTMLFDGTLNKTLGERIRGVLPWIGNFDGSALGKKCPGLVESLEPNCLEAHGADCNSTEACRLYTIA